MPPNAVPARCCDCGGNLTVVEKDTTFLTVMCLSCGNCYGIEVAVAPDGNVTYWPMFRIALKGEPS